MEVTAEMSESRWDWKAAVRGAGGCMGACVGVEVVDLSADGPSDLADLC